MEKYGSKCGRCLSDLKKQLEADEDYLTLGEARTCYKPMVWLYVNDFREAKRILEKNRRTFLPGMPLFGKLGGGKPLNDMVSEAIILYTSDPDEAEQYRDGLFEWLMGLKDIRGGVKIARGCENRQGMLVGHYKKWGNSFRLPIVKPENKPLVLTGLGEMFEDHVESPAEMAD